jgi:tRNA(fMet)-specific endonuclease VapC
MRYLLDTNTVSELVRDPGGRVAQRIGEVGETQVCTSIIVAAELRYGAAKRRFRRLSAQLETVLGVLGVLPFEAPADAVYGVLRARLERAGTPIGANDLLIAAQAIALGCALVTDNQREFTRIDNLAQENWLRQVQ